MVNLADISIRGSIYFEEGYFNIYGSCLLRVENFISILRQNNVDI